MASICCASCQFPTPLIILVFNFRRPRWNCSYFITERFRTWLDMLYLYHAVLIKFWVIYGNKVSQVTTVFLKPETLIRRFEIYLLSAYTWKIKKNELIHKFVQWYYFPCYGYFFFLFKYEESYGPWGIEKSIYYFKKWINNHAIPRTILTSLSRPSYVTFYKTRQTSLVIASVMRSEFILFNQ